MLNYLSRFNGLLKGKKTYVVGIVGLVYAISGFLLGELETSSAVLFALNGLGAITIRLGVAAKTEKNDKLVEIIEYLGAVIEDYEKSEKPNA